MIIQDQDRKHLYNSDLIGCIAIAQDEDISADGWVIGLSFEAAQRATYMAVYSTQERAQFELDRLVEAFARDAKVYVMPEE